MPAKSTVRPLWRGGLPPFDCEAVVNPATMFHLTHRVGWLGAASLPNGGKPPRHKSPLLRGLAQGRYGVDRFTDERRALIDEARIQLHQTRTCSDFLSRVLAFSDATHGDDRQTAGQFCCQDPDGVGALVANRRAGQTARLVAMFHAFDADPRSEER